jgi:hypothetical protein
MVSDETSKIRSGSRGMDPDPYYNIKDPQQWWEQNLVIQLEVKLKLSISTEASIATKKGFANDLQIDVAATFLVCW